jgi:hypothetical protein
MEDAMTRWREEAGDLFATRQLKQTLQAPQRAAAVKLLTMLLVEALRPSAEQDILANASEEAAHDNDYA